MLPIPAIPGMATSEPLTHVGALELGHLPAHLVVLGGGYVGVELAQAFRRFGSKVTVVQHGSQLLLREDGDVAEAVQTIFEQDGIERHQERPHPRELVPDSDPRAD